MRETAAWAAEMAAVGAESFGASLTAMGGQQRPQNFAARWGLDAASLATLVALSGDVQEKLMAEFAPKLETRDVNGLFRGFAKYIAGGGAPRENAERPIGAPIGASGGRGGGGGAEQQSPRFPVTGNTDTAAGAYTPDGNGVWDGEGDLISKVLGGGLAAYDEAAAAVDRQATNPEAEAEDWHIGQGGAAIWEPWPGQEGQPDSHAADEGSSDEEVAAFVAKWGLDSESRVSIEQLPAELQERVLAGFAPKPHTRDVNGLFRGFVRSFLRSAGGPRESGGGRWDGGAADVPPQRAELWGAGCGGAKGGAKGSAKSVYSGGDPKGGGAVASQRWGGTIGQPAAQARASGWRSSARDGPALPDLQAFVDGFALDEASVAALMALSPDQQEATLARFAPKAHTRDVNGLFQGFARSLARGSGGGAAGAGGPGHANQQAVEQRAVTFAQQRGLDAQALKILLSLSPKTRARLYGSFAPKPHTRDVNALFRGFVRSLQRSEWCTAWCVERGLDQACLNVLLSMSPDNMEQVMTNFCARPGTRNPCSLFQSYCRSFSGEKGKGKGKGGSGGKGIEFPPEGGLYSDEAQSWKRARME